MHCSKACQPQRLSAASVWPAANEKESHCKEERRSNCRDRTWPWRYLCPTRDPRRAERAALAGSFPPRDLRSQALCPNEIGMHSILLYCKAQSSLRQPQAELCKSTRGCERSGLIGNSNGQCRMPIGLQGCHKLAVLNAILFALVL